MKNSKNVILRLSKYKKTLSRLHALGLKKVFSENLADALGVTASQVRKDFSQFGISGNKKGGYEIEELLANINKILGKNRTEKVVLVGCGNMGNALIHYTGFKSEGISIVAAFDSDRSKHSSTATPPILPVEKIEDYIRKNKIKTGIIAVPENAAQSTLDLMAKSGIKGVLNFAPIRLRADDNFIISNVNLEMELETVIYFVNSN